MAYIQMNLRNQQRRKLNDDSTKYNVLPYARVFKLNNTKQIVVKTADITELEVDCIINSTNAKFDNFTGVAKDIADKAGPKYSQWCKGHTLKDGSIPVNSFIVSDGFALPCKNVIHTVVPHLKYYSSEQECANRLVLTIQNILREVARHNWSSVALPPLGAGQCGIDQEIVAKAIVTAIFNLADQLGNHLREIIIVNLNVNVLQYVITMFEDNDAPHREGREQSVANTVIAIAETRLLRHSDAHSVRTTSTTTEIRNGIEPVGRTLWSRNPMVEEAYGLGTSLSTPLVRTRSMPTGTRPKKEYTGRPQHSRNTYVSQQKSKYTSCEQRDYHEDQIWHLNSDVTSNVTGNCNSNSQKHVTETENSINKEQQKEFATKIRCNNSGNSQFNTIATTVNNNRQQKHKEVANAERPRSATNADVGQPNSKCRTNPQGAYCEAEIRLKNSDAQSFREASTTTTEISNGIESVGKHTFDRGKETTPVGRANGMLKRDRPEVKYTGNSNSNTQQSATTANNIIHEQQQQEFATGIRGNNIGNSQLQTLPATTVNNTRQQQEKEIANTGEVQSVTQPVFICSTIPLSGNCEDGSMLQNADAPSACLSSTTTEIIQGIEPSTSINTPLGQTRSVSTKSRHKIKCTGSHQHAGNSAVSQPKSTNADKSNSHQQARTTDGSITKQQDKQLQEFATAIRGDNNRNSQLETTDTIKGNNNRQQEQQEITNTGNTNRPQEQQSTIVTPTCTIRQEQQVTVINSRVESVGQQRYDSVTRTNTGTRLNRTRSMTTGIRPKMDASTYMPRNTNAYDGIHPKSKVRDSNGNICSVPALPRVLKEKYPSSSDDSQCILL